MSRFIALLRASLMLVFVIAVSSASAWEEQPRIATVRGESATVRSGPGDEYYATTKLTEGTSVEIYRLTDGGWCGIRPPEGSFSYVKVSAVQAHPDNQTVLVNMTPGTKTHVGSEISADNHVQYITLQVGERLKQVGGPVQLGSQRWFRVFPPSGEFRWIHLDDLQLQTSPSGLASFAPSSSSADANLDTGNLDTGSLDTGELDTVKLAPQASMVTEPIDVIPRATADQPSAAATGSADASEWKAVEHTLTDVVEGQSALETPTELERMPTRPIEEADRMAGLEADEFGGHQQSTPLSDRGGQPRTASTPAPIPAAAVNAQPLAVAELDLALSEQVAQEIDQWQLADLSARASKLAAECKDAESKQRVLQILGRIADFQEIQTRHQQLTAATLSTSPVHPNQITLASATRPAVPTRHPGRSNSSDDTLRHRQTLPESGETAVRVSARGWLVPVEPRTTNVPRFALTSRDGSILYFISPAQGVDLDPYENHSVRVLGSFESQTHRFALVAHQVEIEQGEF